MLYQTNWKPVLFCLADEGHNEDRREGFISPWHTVLLTVLVLKCGKMIQNKEHGKQQSSGRFNRCRIHLSCLILYFWPVCSLGIRLYFSHIPNAVAAFRREEETAPALKSLQSKQQMGIFYFAIIERSHQDCLGWRVNLSLR